MSPMAGRDPQSGDPMNESAARRAVEDEVAELALEVSFHAEKFEAEHLRVDRHRMGAVATFYPPKGAGYAWPEGPAPCVPSSRTVG